MAPASTGNSFVDGGATLNHLINVHLDPVPSNGARAPRAKLAGVEDTSSDDGSTSEGHETKPTPGSSSTPLEPLEPLEPHEVGMAVVIKQLYAGKEDKRGRWQWQSEMPADLGKPAEDAETEKFAIVARHMRSYGDPQKVLVLESISIQSPLLREILSEVLAGYPGIVTKLKRLEFSGRFESIIHRWPALRTKIAELEEQRGQTDVDQVDLTKRLDHAKLLDSLLVEEFADVYKSMQDMKDAGVITYEHLWIIFEPSTIVFTKRDNQDCALRLQSSKYGKDHDGTQCFWLTCVYVDFDGQRFGVQRLNINIHGFLGTVPINTLVAYPIDLHEDLDSLRTKLIERGCKIEALAGTHYRAYNGVGWRRDQVGDKQKVTVRGRIVVDTFGFNRFNPEQAIYTSPLNLPDSMDTSTAQLRLRANRAMGRFSATFFGDAMTLDDSGMPAEGFFDLDSDQKSQQHEPLSEDQKLICSPFVRGYALREKKWLNFFVNSVSGVNFSENAFEALTLPKNEKSLILAFCDNKRANNNRFDDVIEGKGRGIIILLSGPPGVGKTLTAESVAEQMKVPLFVMAAGDLGVSSEQVEEKLKNCLGMCSRWNAILLLDEADIFLEQRSMHELERNKLVSIFLRVLEYYEGIMFLTTNRVESFDTAFQSRIHVSLQYPELDFKSRKGIWETFLTRHNEAQKAALPGSRTDSVGEASSKAALTGRGDAEMVDVKVEEAEQSHKAKQLQVKLAQPHSMSENDIRKLAQLPLNGREIKNFLKSAQLLASHREEPLKYDHVDTVVSTMAHLHRSSKASEEAKGAIFN